MNGDPVVVTGGPDLGQNGDRNIILWADHRAEEEADLINSTGSKVLEYVGGVMSVGFDLLWNPLPKLISSIMSNSSRWRYPRPYGSSAE